MSRLSQRQAAKAWGMSRATIQRAIASGKLSATEGGTIDASEMLRAFGEARPAQSRSGPVAHVPLVPPDEQAEKAAELARLRAELEAARAMLDAKDQIIAAKDDAIAAMRLLTHDQAPRTRRWWQF
jgi:hypothetical protein